MLDIPFFVQGIIILLALALFFLALHTFTCDEKQVNKQVNHETFDNMEENISDDSCDHGISMNEENNEDEAIVSNHISCLLYTSPSPRD